MMKNLTFFVILFSTFCAILAEGDEGLVRCKRTLECKIFCRYGNTVDENGCPTCDCREPCEGFCAEGEKCEIGPCEGLECHSINPTCTPEPVCPMFKCVPCESGRYMKDQFGCQTCRCLPSTAEILDPGCPMPSCANRCDNGYRYDERGCMTCECNVGCPEIGCARSCLGGFKKDANGCNTCECLWNKDPENRCEEVSCLPGLQCRVKNPLLGCMESCEPDAICTVPSLCESMRDMMGPDNLSDIAGLFESDPDDFGVDSAGLPPVCRSDGSFESRQCGVSMVENEDNCWCVDDRGLRVPEDQLYDDEISSGICATRVSDLMHLTFQLEHDLDTGDVDAAMDDIKTLLQQTVGDWLGVKPGSVVLVEVDIYSSNVMSVHIEVITDGITDLPSAAHQVHTRTKPDVSDTTDQCHFAHDGHCLNVVPGSVHAKHLYPDINPTPVTCFFTDYYRHHKIMVITACVILGLTLALLIMVAAVVRRKRSGKYQFKHKKFQNMTLFQKNLMLTADGEKSELEISEKDEVTVPVPDDDERPLA